MVVRPEGDLAIVPHHVLGLVLQNQIVFRDRLAKPALCPRHEKSIVGWRIKEGGCDGGTRP